MEKTVPLWLRLYFGANVLQDLALGIGLILPASIPFPLAITPLNARFIGALYVAAAIGMALSALAPTRADVRIFVIGFGIVSVFVLFVTVLYWSDFTARRVPILWLVTYTADPIVTALTFVAWKLWRAGQPGRHLLTPLFLAEFAILGVLGLVSLLFPGLAVAFWPWKITPLLAQVYGAFFLTFAVGAYLASGERRSSAILPVVASSFALPLLILIASALHLDRFTPGAPTLFWFAGFGVGGIAFAVALTALLRQPADWPLPLSAKAV
jgi:hypothetical protein